MEAIARHYGVSGLLDTILAALRQQGAGTAALDYNDLAPIDEFHIRGREATEELAALAGVQSSTHVLDVGAGLGGSSRFLAAEHGCEVTGLDVTPEYCELAAALSKLAGLESKTRFQLGSATGMPFPPESFDLAWTQHVQMNISDKPKLYQEIRRVLRPGGRFVFHDILAGPQQPARFPVHWAEDASMSFLIAPDELRTLLEQSGFRVIEWRDTTEISEKWFLGKLEQVKQAGGPPPLGLHLLLGSTAAPKIQNVERNLAEQRIS